MNIRSSSVLFLAALLGPATLSPLSAAGQWPKAFAQPAPVYPYELQKMELEGAVLVSFNVTARGEVTDAAVISSTKRAFEAPALRAVKQWKFTPGMTDGVAVNTPVIQLITFIVSSRDPQTTTSSLVGKLHLRRPVRTVASTR